MSNGCYRCDALIGQFFEHDAWDVDNVTLAVFQIVISEQWVEAIESLGHEYGWAIFSPE
jgi:competence protein CoiA